MLKLLLKNRLKIIFFGFTKDETKNKVGQTIGIVIGIVLFSVILFYSIKLISLIYNRLDLELADLILDISLDYAFAIIFIIIIFTGIATSFYILYYSKDLELLLSLPISYRTVFTYKFIEILISNSYLFIIMIFPFLIAYGVSSKLHLAYYPIMIIIFISILSIPTSIGVLIGMIATRYINPNRAKEIFGVIGGLFAVTIFVSLQIIPRLIVSRTPKPEFMGTESIKQFILATFDKPFLKILPSTWGSNALFYFHNGSYSNFGLNFILVVLTSALLVFLCMVLSQRLYYSGWSISTQAVSRRIIKKEKPEDKTIAGDKRFAARVFTGKNYILVKDLKILFRTPARLMQIFIPFIMYIFLFWLILRDNSGGKIDFFIGINTIFFLFFPLIIISIANMNVSGNNIGGEGLNYWIIKLSPILTKKLLRIKIIFSSTINMLCGIIGIIILYFILKPEPLYIILGLALLILFSWGGSIIGTSIGSFFPVFKPSQSSKSNISFLGGLLIFIFSFVYLLIFIGIVIGVLFMGRFYSWPGLVSFPIILALELIVNVTLYCVLLNFSSYRLNRLEWKY